MSLHSVWSSASHPPPNCRSPFRHQRVLFDIRCNRQAVATGDDVLRGGIFGSHTWGGSSAWRHIKATWAGLPEFSPVLDWGGSAASLLKSPFFLYTTPLAHKGSKKVEDGWTVGESGPLHSFARVGKGIKDLIVECCYYSFWKMKLFSHCFSISASGVCAHLRPHGG